jgi:hypothetical protein
MEEEWWSKKARPVGNRLAPANVMMEQGITIGIVFVFNVVDWLILDWFMFCTLTPRLVVIPGSEGLAAYKDYGFHFRGFLHGTVYSILGGLVIAGIVFILWKSPLVDMKNLLIYTLLLPFWFSALQVSSPLSDEAVVCAVLFYSVNCGHYHQVITEVLPPLFEQYGDLL